MKHHLDDIFTPQGPLKDVVKKPNLDFLMNIFNIPRAFGVSGFGGGWNVGQHSFATALIAMYWANFRNLADTKRDRLVTLALVHDLHESVTGDILPMFKEGSVKKNLDTIQNHIIASFGIKETEDIKVALKISDMIAFLYEINQVSPSILQPKKLKLARTIAKKQTELLYRYALENGIKRTTLTAFLKDMELV